MSPRSTGRRAIAALFLAIMLANLIAPTAAYALTSGPTQPEATSFEPIDTTDMVNLSSGNLTYNMPLVEVPGPEGGYPLSLSYHAGVQPNEDASWVGLGWTLNPGAISRFVNGYADDWTNPVATTRTYWKGGTVSTYSIGITIGLNNTPFGVTAGLSFSNDTYQGFGVGLDFSTDLSFGASFFSANIGVGGSAMGGGGALSGGIGLRSSSISGMNASLSLNATTNFESTSAGFNVGIGLTGEGSLKPALSGGWGETFALHTSNPSIQTQTSGFSFSIPVIPGLGIALGYQKVRYHTDETTTTTTQGSLYTTNLGHGTTIPDNIAFDSYSLLLDPSEQNYLDHPDPNLVQGGAFPAFDDYQVNAQGLMGDMRPYQFQAQVFGLNRTPTTVNGCSGQPNCTGYISQFFSPNTTPDPTPQFRFVNDFANTYQQKNFLTYSAGQLSGSTPLSGQSLPFDPTPVYGKGDGTNGFKNNQLAGSRYVTMGINVTPLSRLGYVRTDRYQTGMIEGFSITNESGVTYTFGLPAYSYGEEAYQEKVDHTGGYYMNRQAKATPYAYAWYLTSITGPDWVDRNQDGKADDGDWGYWVDFEYGKWTDDYIWRNPSEGYNEDEDNDWQNCSVGHKEVYYLNAIRTRTHVALFEKDVRVDGKGEGTNAFTKNNTSAGPYYTYPGVFDNTSASSLQLSHIYLLNAADENFVTPGSGTLNGNVLDATDVNAVGRSNLEAKAIRVIDFNYDYSLCPNTTNSFTSPGTLSGKLTLKTVNTRGQGGASSIPPISLQYDLGNSAVTQSVTLTGANGATPGSFTTSSNSFNVGDMITSSSLGVYCGAVISKSGPSGGIYTYTLANCNYTGGAITATVSTTKNPPYNKDAYDSWGAYKSDFSTALLASDINLARTTTAASAPGTDAWSLRGITTQLGAQINVNYESDSYFNSSAEPNQPSLVIDNIQLNPSTQTMTLTIDKGGNNAIHLGDSYSVGSQLNAILMQEFHWGTGVPSWQTQDGTDAVGCMVTDTRTNTTTFSDNLDNFVTNSLGYGYNLNFYTNQAVNGSFTVTGIDDVNSTLTVQCTDPFLVGQQTFRTVAVQRKTGSTYTTYNYKTYLGGSFGGNLFIKPMVPFYGGGIRVQKLSVQEGVTGAIRSTSYSYNDNSGNSSGVSSYTPSMGEPCFNFPSQFSSFYTFFSNTSNYSDAQAKAMYYRVFRRVLYNNNSVLFALAREMPAPGVMYGTVSVSKQIKNADEAATRNLDGISRTQYQFETFKGNMVGRIPVAATQTGTTTGTVYTQSARYYALEKFLGAIGNVKSIIQYDNNGNKVTETVNHYLHDNLINQDATAAAFMADYKTLLGQPPYNYQGYIQERYSEVKLIGQQALPGDQGMKATFASREEYPAIPTGRTVINYVNGTVTNTKNLSYDFYTGVVTSTVETDAYGNNVLTETVPAYTLTAYPAMGLMVTSPTNKNMLSQVAEKRVWKVDGSYNKTGLISDVATTWSDGITALDNAGGTHLENAPTETIGGTTYNSADVWRQQYTYKWMPTNTTTDGTTPFANTTPFNFSTPSSNAAPWKKTDEITLYDVNSKSLEEKDINGIFSAARMGFNNTKVVLTGTPAAYPEIAYSGAEDEGTSQTNNYFVKAGNGVPVGHGAPCHTGTQSLQLAPSSTNKGFIYTVPTASLTSGRNYLVSAWASLGGNGPLSNAQLYYTVNGTTVTSPTAANSGKADGIWNLMTLVIPATAIASGSTLEIGCINTGTTVAYLDDFTFRPIDANTTAYVYDPASGNLTYMIDKNNLYTRFSYDPMGRLLGVFKEKLNVGELQKTAYQYNMGGCTYSNGATTQYYTKNNCNSGYVGSIIPYTIPAGRYCSAISSQDITNQVNADLAGNGQQYANTRGGCFIGGVIMVTTDVPNQNPAEVIAFDAATGAYVGNWICENGTTYINLSVGSYNLEVYETNNASRVVSLTGFPNQTGSTVTFNNVTIGLSQLTINVQ